MISQRRLAEQARDGAQREAFKAEQIQGYLQDIFSSIDPANAKGREITVREVLEAAVRRLEEAPLEMPDVEAAIRQTMGDTFLSLGLYDRASTQLQSALALRRDLPDDMGWRAPR